MMKKTMLLASAGLVLFAALGFGGYKYLEYGSGSRPIHVVKAEYDRNIEARRGRAGFGYQGFGRGIETVAAKLGMTVDELRSQLGSKTMLEIAEEKGISQEQFHQMMIESAIQRWKDAGFSDKEIAERQKMIEERQQNCNGEGLFRGSPFRN